MPQSSQNAGSVSATTRFSVKVQITTDQGIVLDTIATEDILREFREFFPNEPARDVVDAAWFIANVAEAIHVAYSRQSSEGGT